MNAAQEAEKIRALAWNDKFPVDPIAIAIAIGVDVYETSLPKEVSGALIKEVGDDAKIVIEHSDNNNRKRFSCAHELGHYVARAESSNEEKEYEYIDLRSESSSNGNNPDEIFANQFAACLLMPEKKVKDLVHKGKSHIEMALFFGVSNEAMKFRLKNLSLLK